MSELAKLSERLRAKREAVDAAGETFYQGPSKTDLASFPPKERWDDWVELDSRQWPRRVERHSMLIPTTCFNCESACGLLAYVDRNTLQVRKFEGNPEHPGSRGRNCAKGPATINQVTDPDRILYPLKRVGPRGQGRFGTSPTCPFFSRSMIIPYGSPGLSTEFSTPSPNFLRMRLMTKPSVVSVAGMPQTG